MGKKYRVAFEEIVTTVYEVDMDDLDIDDIDEIELSDAEEEGELISKHFEQWNIEDVQEVKDEA